jgi:hypothetical protein
LRDQALYDALTKFSVEHNFKPCCLCLRCLVRPDCEVYGAWLNLARTPGFELRHVVYQCEFFQEENQTEGSA